MTRRAWIVVFLVAVVATDLVFVATRGGGRSHQRPVIVTAAVTRRTLDATVTLNGTLSRLDQRTVTSVSSGQVSDVSISNGQIVQAGQSLIGVGGRESVAEDGAFPFFRSLTLGDSGQDVAQLDQILAAQGYYPGPVGDVFTRQTQFALAQWQADHGYPGVGPTKPETVDIALEPSSYYKIGAQGALGMQIDTTQSSAAASVQSLETNRTAAAVRLVSAFRTAESLPVLTIDAVNQVTEKGSPAVFVVYSSAVSSSPLDFSVAEGGNAPSNEVLPPLGPFVLPAGSSSVEIDVPTRENGLVQPSATVTLALQAGSGYTVGSPGVGQTVVESPDLPQLTLSGGGSVQPGGTATVTVTANQAPVQPTQIVLSATGDAQAGTDYVPLDPTLTLEPGQTTASVAVQTMPATAIRPNRYVVVSLAPSGAYTLGATSSATVTILGPGGQAALPVVTIRAQTQYVTKGEPVSLLMSLSQAVSSPLTVALDYGGSARQGSDYIVPGPVTVPAGQTSAQVTIPTVTDDVTEPDTTLTVEVAAGSSYQVGSPSEATATITSPVVPTLNLTASSSPVTQGAETSFTITADQAPVKATTVTFQVSGTAQPGQAYEPLTGTALIPAGRTSVTVPLVTLDNDVVFDPTDMIAGHWPIRIGQVFVKAGDSVPQPGADLFSLTDTNFTVTLTATPAERTQLQVGQTCTVELQDGSAQTNGVISQLDDNVTVNATTGAETYSGKIAVSDLGAADGASVTIDVTDQAADNVLSVPIAAVLQNGSGKDVVRVIDLADGGRITEVPVRTGLSDSSYIEIKSGLSEGQVVVVEEDASS